MTPLLSILKALFVLPPRIEYAVIKAPSGSAAVTVPTSKSFDVISETLKVAAVTRGTSFTGLTVSVKVLDVETLSLSVAVTVMSVVPFLSRAGLSWIVRAPRLPPSTMLLGEFGGGDEQCNVEIVRDRGRLSIVRGIEVGGEVRRGAVRLLQSIVASTRAT